MPQIVTDQNGARHEFPDEATPEMISKALGLGPKPAPAPASATPGLDIASTSLGGLIEGVPIVGPMIRGGLERAAAATRAAFTDETYQENLDFIRRDNARMKQERPVLDTASQVAGAVAGTVPMVMAAPAAFGAGAGSLGLRMAASGASGAALGGADAAVRSEGDMEHTGKGALIGALLGGAGPAVAAGAGRLAGALAGKVRPGEPAPSIDQLRGSANAAYKAADDAGLVISQPAVTSAVDDLGRIAADAGFHPRIHPKVAAALDAVAEAKAGPQSLERMDQYRRILKSAASSSEPDERRIASALIDALDDKLSALTPKDVIAGNAEEGVAALTKARELWSRMRKSELVAEALEKAERRAASTGSGGNLENAIRQNVRAILDNPRKARLFSAEEREAMETVVRGSAGQNFARLVGKLSPQGNGLMAALGIGATAMNPLMAAAPAAGFVGKKIAEGATNRNAALVDALVRNGGPLAEPPLSLPARQSTEALIRALMTSVPPVANQRRLAQ